MTTVKVRMCQRSVQRMEVVTVKTVIFLVRLVPISHVQQNDLNEQYHNDSDSAHNDNAHDLDSADNTGDSSYPFTSQYRQHFNPQSLT